MRVLQIRKVIIFFHQPHHRGAQPSSQDLPQSLTLTFYTRLTVFPIVRSLNRSPVVLQMWCVPVVEEADEIVIDDPVFGRQEVEVDKLGRRPDEPFREPQLSAQLFCVLNLGTLFAMNYFLSSLLSYASTHYLTRRFCLKYGTRDEYAGRNAYRAEKNLKRNVYNFARSTQILLAPIGALSVTMCRH